MRHGSPLSPRPAAGGPSGRDDGSRGSPTRAGWRVHRSALLLVGLLLAGDARPVDAQAAPVPQVARPAAASGFAPGPLDAITDVAGVRVGHVTLVEGEDVRTGVTAVLPHGGNLFRSKVPAAVAVANGFGKLVGTTQLEELGQLETPVVLTNTLSVWEAGAALVEWTLSLPGNEDVTSVNPVVGETNDGYLNDIRRRAVKREHVLEALRTAREGPVAQGSVGAGTGTTAFGPLARVKSGIGTASRRAPAPLGGDTVGVLVQVNFGGTYRGGPGDGRPVPATPPRTPPPPEAGSCMIVVATDAPLDARELRRLASRAFAGMARTGASFSSGSGDYAIAFSTAESVRMPHPALQSPVPLLPPERVDALFLMAAEATEAAIRSSLVHAAPMRGFRGREVPALPHPAEASGARDPASPRRSPPEGGAP